MSAMRARRAIPTLGSGLIFPVAEEDIVVAPFALPKHWPQIGGMDFGYDHPFAAVKLAHDRDNRCVVYVAAEYRKSQQTADYVNARAIGLPNARRIVNGRDRAAEIAAIARAYDTELKAFGYGRDKPACAAPPILAPSPIPRPALRLSFWARLLALFKRRA